MKRISVTKVLDYFNNMQERLFGAGEFFIYKNSF
jgi:hypothetical protein